MGCLSRQLHEQLWPNLRGLPQFAYVPGRGCDDALHRIALHCLEVRDCIDTFKFAVHQQSTGTLPGALGGGLLLSLDLSKAFDAVRRSQLFTGLAKLGISSDLLNFLKSLYSRFRVSTMPSRFQHQTWHQAGVQSGTMPMDSTGGIDLTIHC